MSTEAHILVIVLAAAVIAVHRAPRAQSPAAREVLGAVVLDRAGLAVLAIFPDLLVEVSDIFGIGYPPATFMLLALSFLLVLVLHFSWELSRLEDRTRTLAEEHALLREEFEALGPATRGPPAADTLLIGGARRHDQAVRDVRATEAREQRAPSRNVMRGRRCVSTRLTHRTVGPLLFTR